MTNAINTNYFLQYQNAGQLGKQAAQNKAEDKNPLTSYLADATVEISDAGLNALQVSRIDASGAANDEQKLSAKAQSFLEGLRKKYGNYDFVVSNDLDTSKTLGNTKEYSVLLTTDELEKMAEDDDYAQKVMGQVGNAVDVLKGIAEKDLGEGVQFSQLAASFDSEGNMKLFAQLEKLSADQKERLDAALEKRAEEKSAAEKTQVDKNKKNDFTTIIFKSADVEASSAKELFEKIVGIAWKEIPDEKAHI